MEGNKEIPKRERKKDKRERERERDFTLYIQFFYLWL